MSQQPQQARRSTDSTLSDIEQMIAEENDSEKRGTLMVLNAIAVNLHANTLLTQELGKKMEQHLEAYGAHTKREEALFNRGRGAWLVFAWVMSAAQVFLVIGGREVYDKLSGIDSYIQAAQITKAQFELRLQQLERKP